MKGSNIMAKVVIGTMVGFSVFGSNGCTKRVPNELKGKILVEATMCEKRADSLVKEVKMGKVADADVEKNIITKLSKAQTHIENVKGANYENADTGALQSELLKAKEKIEVVERDLEAVASKDSMKSPVKGIVQ
ncbi:hypothetical protein COU37_02025 [Candidatus Micrarchaeota archaeon CG10_big_fil_rev_8_21_14_0_10_45_29]|nr:MAG: hypothetical protein COU37_02025 [Candidatus Micrarchaeota archaeon CG10_big_fil_rev_8_21_14_0_10_45_29]